MKLLDEGDFNEYRNMIGEWEPPAGTQSATAITHLPPLDNPIFGYIINRLHNLVHPPAVCLVFVLFGCIEIIFFSRRKNFHLHYFQHLVLKLLFWENLLLENQLHLNDILKVIIFRFTPNIVNVTESSTVECITMQSLNPVMIS